MFNKENILYTHENLAYRTHDQTASSFYTNYWLTAVGEVIQRIGRGMNSAKNLEYRE